MSHPRSRRGGYTRVWEVGSQGVTLESAYCNFGNLSSIEENKILGHWFK